MRNEKTIGLPVIHIDLGKRYGTVHNLILDPAQKKVAGLLIALGGWRRKGVLPTEQVYAFGEDAVTIDDEGAILPLEDESELRRLWLRRLDLVGMQVLSVRGNHLGCVASYEFSSGGIIETIQLTRTKRKAKTRTIIPGSMVRSFGDDAVIVASDAEEWVGSDAQEKHRGPVQLLDAPAAEQAPVDATAGVGKASLSGIWSSWRRSKGSSASATSETEPAETENRPEQPSVP